MVLSSISYALSAYTLGRLATLSVRLELGMWSDVLIWLAKPFGLMCSVLMILMYFLVAKVISVRWTRPLGWLGGVWMGYLTLTLFYAGPLHLMELILTVFKLNSDSLINMFSITSLTVVHSALVYGVWNASRSPLLKAVNIQDQRIGKDLDH